MQNEDLFKEKLFKIRDVSSQADLGEDSDATAETRSAPGDLAKLPQDPGPSGENK